MEQVINNINASIRKFADDVEETRTVTFIASTDSKDRHGTVLNQDNWSLKNFNNNPIIGYQHNVYGGGMCDGPNPDDQLGSAKAYFETVKRAEGDSQQLMVDITFEPEDINPLAEKIFRKVMHGSLRAVSVGFVPKKNASGQVGEERDGAFHYFGQELLEVSVVNIPSNPDALKRSFRDSTSSALVFLKKTLDKSFGEIEEMKVKDILNVLDGRNVEEPIVDLNTTDTDTEDQENIEENNLDLAKRMLTLAKLKGYSIKSTTR